MINNLSNIVDHEHQVSYRKLLNDVAAELRRITSGVSDSVYNKYDTNNVQFIDDAQESHREILEIFHNTEQQINLARCNFIKSYDSWLANCSASVPSCSDLDANQNEDIVVLENSNVSDILICEDQDTPDIEVVNVVKYPQNRKVLRGRKNVATDKEVDCIDLSCSQPIASRTEEILHVSDDLDKKNCDIKVSLNNNTVEGITNNVKQFDSTKYLPKKYLLSVGSNSNDNEENPSIECKQENNYLDQELAASDSDNSNNSDYSKKIKECFVRLESLHEETIEKFLNKRKKSKQSSEDDAFLRLIDLSRLERPKRRYSTSSDDSLTTNSSENDDGSLAKKRLKRRKISSDDTDSDVSSYYESSNDEADDNSTAEKMKVDEPSFEKLDKNEEKAKFLLLEDSNNASDDSDMETDSDEDEPENAEEKIDIKEKSSKKLEKNNSSRSAWLNDKLLRFKLPDDTIHEKRKDSNDAESPTSSYGTLSESITSNGKEVMKTDVEITESESSESGLSEDSEGSESSSDDLDNEDTKNDFETSISIATPNSKVAGRRNIRPVLDDQHITENTRQAEKDEQSRLQRLAVLREQMNSLVRLKENANSLILDFDVDTKKNLVAIDKGLVKLLKSHQREGIKFMWDCCFESVEQLKNHDGSGCILAHCMGLGKTLQIITLVHTLLAKDLKINTVMIVCPTNTILNWVDEFNMWMKHACSDSNIKIFELTRVTGASSRVKQLGTWQQKGGVLIISYESFRSFTSPNKYYSSQQTKKMREYLINPGADLVVCDEGHLLKNDKSQIAERMQQVKTQRRIILTGTPLQNNLDEYHCMVQFVKPNLLGTKKEFLNRFANPIQNGQYDNSTPDDVKLMKHRAHVLHRLLEGCVQRCDYEVLKPLLPEKQEYVVTVRLSDTLEKMYRHFIGIVVNASSKQSNLLKSYNVIKRLVAHPKTLELKVQHQLKQQKNDPECRSKRKSNSPSSADKELHDGEGDELWWRDLVDVKDLEDLTISYKLMLLFGLLQSCGKRQNKILVFSQCLSTLSLIELILQKLDSASDHGLPFELEGEWKKGVDYFRIDSKVSPKARRDMCTKFNDPSKKRGRLFLISTRAGGMGINLTGANRVVVFDPSWNPSNDLQSIFRVFRFGQEKPCFVYRFLTAGTMEEKIYIRQVMKLSLSLRVLDEQQVGRHYRDTDLTNLYKLEPLAEKGPEITTPRDDLLAEVIAKYSEYVYNVFEHDSLLQNKEEEELNEEERKQAWQDYQENLAAEKEQASSSSVESDEEVPKTASASKDLADVSE